MPVRIKNTQIWAIQVDKGGMKVILSQKQIEEIAAAVTKNFKEFFFGEDADVCIPRATPIWAACIDQCHKPLK